MTGPTSWSPDDPLRALFSLARYKFVRQMFAGRQCVLEIGCGDGHNAPVVAAAVGSLTITDREPMFMELMSRRYGPDNWPFGVRLLDIMEEAPPPAYDGIYALDVLEHIPAKHEDAVMANICAGLTPHGAIIVGMPSLESQAYASPISRAKHVNCKTQAQLRALMTEYFHDVFMFGMNDEVLHTGFGPMSHYLLALCCGEARMTPSEILNRIRGLRVLVVGDLIMDQYISVVPDRISQAEDNIVFKRIGEQMFLGGAGIVAAHCASLGGTASLVSLVGDDDLSATGAHMLRQAGVDIRLVMDYSRKTTLKQRWVSRSGRVVHREDQSSEHEPTDEIAGKIVDEAVARLNGAGMTDLLLFADFGFHALPLMTIDLIAAAARDYQVMTAADSQATSEGSGIARYLRMDLITPTEKEARLALGGDWRSPLPDIAKNLQAITLAKDVAITLAEDGVFVEPVVGIGKYIPALNKAPRDVVGAGDALFATAAMALCVGADIWDAVRFGSIAAAAQVGRLGNVPLTPEDLLREEWT